MKKIVFSFMVCLCGCLGDFSKGTSELCYKGGSSVNNPLTDPSLARLLREYGEIQGYKKYGYKLGNRTQLNFLEKSNLEGIKLRLKSSETSTKYLMVRGARKGNEEWLKLALLEGADNFREAANAAFNEGHFSISIRLILRHVMHTIHNSKVAQFGIALSLVLAVLSPTTAAEALKVILVLTAAVAVKVLFDVPPGFLSMISLLILPAVLSGPYNVVLVLAAIVAVKILFDTPLELLTGISLLVLSIENSGLYNVWVGLAIFVNINTRFPNVPPEFIAVIAVFGVAFLIFPEAIPVEFWQSNVVLVLASLAFIKAVFPNFPPELIAVIGVLEATFLIFPGVVRSFQLMRMIS